MNKRIDFTKLGGFGVTQDTFAFQQDGIKAITDAVGFLVGADDLVIVGGVEDLGTSWGDGFVSINGEVLPFIGGIKQARVLIEEVVGTAPFADLTNKDVYYTRVAKLGNVGGYDFNDFIRQKTVNELNALLEQLLIASPKTGFITMYSGVVEDIPEGWALCDGGNGTPDLRGRFVAGYSGAGDYATIGAVGGEETVTLTEGQLPAVSLDVVLPARVDRNWFNNGGNTHKIYDETSGTSTVTVGFGGGESHENRPPYYVLAFIMKL